MKEKKRFGLILALAVVLALLVFPGWNPLLDEGGKQAVTVQVQQAFGGLFGGMGVLTPARLISAAAVVVFVCLVSIVVCWILELVAKKGKHRQSMAGLFASLTRFICSIVGVVWALGILGVDLASIFASLGVASLIIGFGAQSLIEDAVTGIFIIFEGQYQVGDIIVLDDFRGTVKSIGIRTTSIEDAGGNLKIVNNSDIRNLQQRSRATSVAVCDVSISYDADLQQVEDILVQALPDIYEKHQDLFLSLPCYAGVEALADSAVVLRFIVEVSEENFFSGRRALTRELKLLMDQNNIEIPFPQMVVHTGK